MAKKRIPTSEYVKTKGHKYKKKGGKEVKRGEKISSVWSKYRVDYSRKELSQRRIRDLENKYNFRIMTKEQYQQYYTGDTKDFEKNWKRLEHKQELIKHGQYKNILTKQYRNQYIEAMKGVGISKEVVDRFKRLDLYKLDKIAETGWDKAPSPNNQDTDTDYKVMIGNMVKGGMSLNTISDMLRSGIDVQSQYTLPSLSAFYVYTANTTGYISDKDEITEIEREIVQALKHAEALAEEAERAFDFKIDVGVRDRFNDIKPTYEDKEAKVSIQQLNRQYKENVEEAYRQVLFAPTKDNKPNKAKRSIQFEKDLNRVWFFSKKSKAKLLNKLADAQEKGLPNDFVFYEFLNRENKGTLYSINSKGDVYIRGVSKERLKEYIEWRKTHK